MAQVLIAGTPVPVFIALVIAAGISIIILLVIICKVSAKKPDKKTSRSSRQLMPHQQPLTWSVVPPLGKNNIILLK
jgi:hypothetical protein